MSLTLNMVGGGGGGLSSTDAVLRVQAPAQSTVTISKGTTIKTDLGHENADDSTVFDYYFIIHQSQFDGLTPWTVTATKTYDTKSTTIIIDDSKEYNVVLKYPTWLFKSGYGEIVEFQQFYDSGSTITVTDDYVAFSISNGASAYFAKNAIDLTKYSVLKCEATITGQSGNSDWLGCLEVKSSLGGQTIKPSINSVARTNFTANSTRQTYSVSLTSITGSRYCGVCGNIGGTIYNIWLEEAE